MNKKMNSVTSAETKDEVSANVEVTTSSPNNAKPDVVCRFSPPNSALYDLLSKSLIDKKYKRCEVDNDEESQVTFNKSFDFVNAKIIINKSFSVLNDNTEYKIVCIYYECNKTSRTLHSLLQYIVQNESELDYLLKIMKWHSGILV